MQLNHWQVRQKAEAKTIEKKNTTFCPISLLAFSDFERAGGLSLPGPRIHMVIKNFYGLQVYLIVHVKRSNDPITHVIPVMRCYAT